MTPTRRSPLPGARQGLIALALIACAVLAWRFAPTWAGFAASGLALVWTWRAGRAMAGDGRWLEHLAGLAVVVSAVLMIAKHEPAWWPCDISCLGGGGYERLFGVFVVKLAFAGCLLFYAAIAASGIWCRRSGLDPSTRAPAPLQAIGWMMIGISCFYLWTSARLGVACHQCLAMHTVVLAMAGPLRLATLRTIPRIASVAAGFTLLLVAYGPGLRTDIASGPTTHTTPSAADEAYLARIDANRSFGRMDAPFVLDLVLEFQCLHCAVEYTELAPALRAAIDDGRLQLVVRPIARRSEPASIDLVRWSLAAAAEGERPFRRYLDAMLGTRTGVTSTQILSGPNAEPAHLAGLAREADAHDAAIARLISSDASRIAELGAAGAMPFAALRDRAGARLGRWSVHIDREQVLSAIIGTTSGTGPVAP
ncbi:MAG: thioredoxin domain-containing protein [Planctomycetes bacterium]|nr:thioredoxin domain-containing protein [Planctomycetota bacterium]